MSWFYENPASYSGIFLVQTIIKTFKGLVEFVEIIEMVIVGLVQVTIDLKCIKCNAIKFQFFFRKIF